MACFHPLAAWKLQSGEVVFAERGNILRALTLPCGQCIGCRLERSRQWAVRCVHEAKLHDHNSFITLTYSDDNLPHNNSLDYRHFQLFLKRLRKSTTDRVRFYMCGEYGEVNFRPHFHACIFGHDFPDKQHWTKLRSGSSLYRSSTLESLWPFGHSSIGDVTFESAAYVARYVVGKVTGDAAIAHYSRVDSDTGEVYSITPEFTRMSLKPGIGAEWFAKYRTDAYSDSGARDYVVIRGKKMKPPRYYDKLLKEATDFTSDYVEYLRYQDSLGRLWNNTPERLAVRETVTTSALNLKRRSL